jgi:hypothetical protein
MKRQEPRKKRRVPTIDTIDAGERPMVGILTEAERGVLTESSSNSAGPLKNERRFGSQKRPGFAFASRASSRGHWWRWVPSSGSLSRYRKNTTCPAVPLTRTPPPSKRNHSDSLDHLLSRRDRNRRNPIRPAPQAAGASSEPPHMPRITWAQSADNSWWTIESKLSNQRIGSTLRLGPRG